MCFTARFFQLGLGVIFSAAALYLALRGVHWHEVGLAAKDANYLLISLAAALLFVAPMLRALRWRILLHPIQGVRLFHLFGSLNVGYLMNNVLPFQMGDLGRVYLVSELSGISTTRCLSTIVVERVLDVLTLLAFLLFLAPFVDIPGWARTPAVLLASGFSLLAVILIVASLRGGPVMRLIEGALRLAPARSRPKLEQMVHSALDGFAVLTNPRIALGLVGCSAIIWLSTSLIVFLGVSGFDLGVGYDAALLVLIATTFGMFVPASPGAFGVYHAIVIGTLTSVFDVDRSAAVSYALIIHLVFYLPPVIIGTIFLWYERRLWRQTSLFEKLAELRGQSQPPRLVAVEGRD